MFEYTVRPIQTWPGKLRAEDDRVPSPFKAGWSDTLDVLRREVDHLDGQRVVLQLDLRDRDVRLDGMMRADARPGHPGVILSFDSVHGPLRFATDLYRHGYGSGSNDARLGWRGNLRAVALGLEGLRKFDRYGITRGGEQYTGWKQLGSGIAVAAREPAMTVDEAARVVVDLAGREWHGDDFPDAVDAIISDVLEGGTGDALRGAYRFAARNVHPDAGGTTEQFHALEEAKRVLDQRQEQNQ